MVLNSCWAPPEQAEAIAREVDCVVGMSARFDDRSAIYFAGGFYQELGFGRSVRKAFEAGCLEIELEKSPGAEIPKLIARVGVDTSAVLFED